MQTRTNMYKLDIREHTVMTSMAVVLIEYIGLLQQFHIISFSISSPPFSHYHLNQITQISEIQTFSSAETSLMVEVKRWSTFVIEERDRSVFGSIFVAYKGNWHSSNQE